MMSLRSARGVKSGVDDEMIMLCIARDPIENVSHRNLERERRNSENIATTTLCGALRKALLTHIHVRFEFLAWLLCFLFHFLSILSSPSPQAKLHQCQLQQSQSTLLLSNFPPSTQCDAHTLVSHVRELPSCSPTDAMLTICLEKLVFLRNSSPWLGATHQAKRALNKVEMKLERKRKKAISLIKRWFFTVDRLSWS